MKNSDTDGKNIKAQYPLVSADSVFVRIQIVSARPRAYALTNYFPN